MRHRIGFLGILLSLLSLFFISSCHNMEKKTSCSKKYDPSKDMKKKDCCAKKRGKKKHFKWGNKQKKDCCGKASFAGFSSVKALNKEKISGSVYFEKIGKYEIKVTADINGLPPNKQFGFHVHEFGTCENKALLAGGHLNPWGSKHAGPQSKSRHLGDLGNLKSDKSGKAVYSQIVRGKLKQFMGRSVIIHAKADDMKTQPTGNSGNRIACGVIVASMPPIQKEEPADEKPALDKAVSNQKTEAQKASKEKELKKIEDELSKIT